MTTKPRGKHPEKRLSAIGVRATKEPGRYADGNGLYLVVDPSGAKRWIWRGVIRGKRSDLGLGGVQLVSLADAREKATRLRQSARKGENPLTERRRAQRVLPTFKAIALEVHATRGASFRNPKHKAQWLATLQADVFPAFGDRAVNTITTGDVLSVLAPIWATKPETARRIKQRITAVFDWAKAQGYREGDNPTIGLKDVLPKHRAEKQHHAALPYARVPAFLVSLRASDAAEPIRLAFELAILTATRTNEVQGATWDEVDLEAQIWTIRAGRMKMGREHRIPLSPRAVEIFTRAKAITPGGPFVFAGRTPDKPISNMAFLMVLRRLKQDAITTHGFRSSFRDFAAEQTNVPNDVCEAALAHKLRDPTEAAYKRTDLFEKRRALMETWEQFATKAPA